MQMKKQAKKYTNTKTQIKGNEEYAEEDTDADNNNITCRGRHRGIDNRGAENANANTNNNKHETEHDR